MKDKKDDDEILADIKKDISGWFEYFRDNIEHYKKMMRFAFKSTLSEEEIQKLDKLKKPAIEINYMSPYLDSLLGEYSSQTPSVSVSGSGGNTKIDSATLEVIEKNVTHIFGEYEKYYKNDVLKQQCAGSFSVLEVLTDYRNNNTLAQDIFIKSNDPTLCFFDKFAKRVSKIDGRFSGKISPIPVEEFKQKYPEHKDDIDGMQFSLGDSFPWFFHDGEKGVVVVADYYVKEYKKKTLVRISDGSEMSKEEFEDLILSWNNFEPKPEIIEERKVNDFDIVRYVIFDKKIIKKEKVNYPGLPYFFVDGNSSYVYDEGGSRKQQVTKSYIANAVGAQKLLNSSAQCVADHLQNLMRSKFLIEKRTIVNPKEWKNIQVVSHLQWDSKDKDGSLLPKPEPIVQPDLHPSIMGTLTGMQSIMQNSLGTYDTSRIAKTELSGIAIEKGATQGNAVSAPYPNNYMLTLNDVSDFIVKLIPIFNGSQSMLPTLDKEGNFNFEKVNQKLDDGTSDLSYPVLKYGENDLRVSVKADYSFELQKDKSLKMMTTLAQHVPRFAKLLGSNKGMKAMLSNIDIRKIETLEEALEEEIAQESQQNTPSPEQIALSVKQKELQLKEQELMLKKQNMQINATVKEKEINMREKELEEKWEQTKLEFKKEIINDIMRRETHSIDNAAKMAGQLLKKEEHEHKVAMDLLQHRGS